MCSIKKYYNEIQNTQVKKSMAPFKSKEQHGYPWENQEWSFLDQNIFELTERKTSYQYFFGHENPRVPLPKFFFYEEESELFKRERQETPANQSSTDDQIPESSQALTNSRQNSQNSINLTQPIVLGNSSMQAHSTQNSSNESPDSNQPNNKDRPKKTQKKKHDNPFPYIQNILMTWLKRPKNESIYLDISQDLRFTQILRRKGNISDIKYLLRHLKLRKTFKEMIRVKFYQRESQLGRATTTNKKKYDRMFDKIIKTYRNL